MKSAGLQSRSGLSAIEVAVLESVEACLTHSAATDRGDTGPRFVPTLDVLDEVYARTGLGPRYAGPLVVDLVVPWVRHLPLLAGDGNFGSIDGDAAAGARYMRVGLSPVGELALTSHRGEIGPLPLDLVEGSWHRGASRAVHRAGSEPPLDPRRVVEALLSGSADPGAPSAPTGTVAADPAGIVERYGQRAQRYLLGSCLSVNARRDIIELRSPPYRVGLQDIADALRSALEAYSTSTTAPTVHYLSEPAAHVPEPPITGVSQGWALGLPSERAEVLFIQVRSGVDVVDALQWLRSIWPVTTHVDGLPMAAVQARLTDWLAKDLSGVAALKELLVDPAATE